MQLNQIGISCITVPPGRPAGLWRSALTGDACWVRSIKKLQKGSMSCAGGHLLTNKDLPWSSGKFTLEGGACCGTNSLCISKQLSASPAGGAETTSLALAVGWTSAEVSGVTSLLTVFICWKGFVSVGWTLLSGGRRAWHFFRWAVLLVGMVLSDWAKTWGVSNLEFFFLII